MYAHIHAATVTIPLAADKHYFEYCPTYLCLTQCNVFVNCLQYVFFKFRFRFINIVTRRLKIKLYAYAA